MKRIVLLSLIFLNSHCIANELHNFEQIKSAAMSGKTIHISVDFKQCSSAGKDSSAPTVVGIFTPDKITVTDTQIATAFTHFTLNNPKYPDQPFYEYVRYTINDGNNVYIALQTIYAPNFSLVGKKQLFNCEVGLGAKFYD